MAKARIYNPGKSAMQSGQALTDDWVLEFAPEQPKRIDPLTGWYGSADMNQQLTFRFSSEDAAVDYARRQGWDYEVEPRRQVPPIRPKSYSDNFRAGRRENWTH
ncbi:ETC complex I subunit [Roseomonas sp. OT10]|uniref:ETC complex I subunit n=1 Tax=Roseomonas cutis TaxID=2897332 RepID=UPI001E4D0F6C|nr:ETC complex I subunit [Roseomonas sp. OT10]UFN50728.1 ETC complex I subunit [Roseomonas sp. OT10]